MIVTSGALVLVAIALLIAGLASSGLGLVWASIVVSLVSAVFLAVGVYQRRNDVPGLELESPAFAPKADEAEGVRTVSSAVVAPAASGSSGTAEGTVYVVEGRPRYHAAGCRYLAGKDSEQRSLSAARTEGYNACGVCKPDETATAAAAPATSAAADEPSSSVKLTKAPAATAARAAKSTASKSAASTAAAKKTTVKKAAPAKKAAATKAATPVKKAAAKKASTATVKKAPAKSAAAKKTTAKKTAAKKTAR